jgi:DNA-binding NarL/FixJ family response regulator
MSTLGARGGAPAERDELRALRTELAAILVTIRALTRTIRDEQLSSSRRAAMLQRIEAEARCGAALCRPTTSGTAVPGIRTARVLVCDRHRLFADSVALVLHRRGYESVVVADATVAALASAASEPLDVCLVDLSLIGHDGMGFFEALRGLAPTVRMIALVSDRAEPVMEQARGAGAMAVLNKSDPVDDYLATVDRLAVGRDIASSSDCGEVRTDGTRRPSAPLVAVPAYEAALSVRELDVLNRLARGDSTNELSARLGIRLSTARTHVQSILMKLQVHSKVEAVTFAVRAGLVSVEQDPAQDRPA